MDARALAYLRCPACKDESRPLALIPEGRVAREREVETGFVCCTACSTQFPIVAGVALLAPDWGELLGEHENFLAAHICEDAVPKDLRQQFFFASAASDRVPVAALDSDLFPYFINHAFFSDVGEDEGLEELISSPRVRTLVCESRRHGPYSYIHSKAQAVRGGLYADVGCGVGTAASLALEAGVRAALGVDRSLPAVFVGRTLLSQAQSAARFTNGLGWGELVVGDGASLPLKSNGWDLVSALNVVDEVERASELLGELERLPAASGLLVLAAPFKSRRTGELAGGAVARGGRFVQTHCETDMPWLVIRGPRYVEMLSIDLYEYQGAR